MNASSSFVMQWESWTILLGIGAVVVTILLSLISCHRSGYRRSIIGLEVLRVAIVATAVWLLNQPEWIEEFKPDEKPTIVVLGDMTGSMSTRDVLVKNEGRTDAVTRESAIAEWMKDSAWNSLRDRFDVIVQPIESDPANGGTDLQASLMAAREKYPFLRGVVLASDGDWNVGLPPVQAAMRLRLDEIPILAVPVGSQTRLPDVELLSLDAPTFGVAGKSVRIPFTVESSLPRDYTTTLVLKTSEGEEVKHEVKVAAMGRTSDAIVWKPEHVGDYTLTLTVPKQADETISDNNQKTAPIAIREEKLKVLVIESYPRWEYRYLRNALSRDPGWKSVAYCSILGSTKSVVETKTISNHSQKGLINSLNTMSYSSVMLASMPINSPKNNADC